MISPNLPLTRLQPRQTRVIHASEGLRLQVVAGRIWLTQPGAVQDVFLKQGEDLDLWQDWIVVEADCPAGCASHGGFVHCAYVLQPLVATQTRGVLMGALWRRLVEARGVFKSWIQVPRPG